MGFYGSRRSARSLSRLCLPCSGLKLPKGRSSHLVQIKQQAHAPLLSMYAVLGKALVLYLHLSMSWNLIMIMSGL